ncbi:hypothetical protein [Bacillus atrophaeus]|nr:hypothetical protein [Bacillus atrophaeus]MBU5262173.1 hypothetical protein [Bacillus atrophaeus]MCY8466604.1 hypothetical protein [Bacillus atrophaeus]MCY8479064.1 hypothetical protein [Bacillus atrophaeus]
MAEKRINIIEDIDKGLNLDQLAQKSLKEGEMHVKQSEDKNKENRK